MGRHNTGSQNAQYSQNTNVHPAFGNVYKVQRNRRLTSSVMKLNYGKWHIGQGIKPIETTNDPLKRSPEYIVQEARAEASIAGRMRGFMRPADVRLTTWKNPYWRQQRPPQLGVIGPFTQSSLPRQSILARVGDFFTQMGGNK